MYIYEFDVGDLLMGQEILALIVANTNHRTTFMFYCQRLDAPRSNWSLEFSDVQPDDDLLDNLPGVWKKIA